MSKYIALIITENEMEVIEECTLNETTFFGLKVDKNLNPRTVKSLIGKGCMTETKKGVLIPDPDLVKYLAKAGYIENPY